MKKFDFHQYGFVHNLIAKGEIRSIPVSMSIGAAIAIHANLPSEGFDDSLLSVYFKDASMDIYREFLNALVDLAPVDLDRIEHYACKFYCLKARLATDVPKGNFFDATQLASSTKSNNCIYDALGLHRVLSDDEVKVLETCPNFYLNLASFIYMVKEVC